MATFPNTVSPIRSSNKQTETRVLEANFGDGYSQRAADGINNVIDVWSLEWVALDSTNYQEIETFLRDRGGWDSFDFTPPGESTSKKFVCKQWNTSHHGNNLYSISATFRQVFDVA